MRFYFARHGETIENRNKITQGQIDGHLTLKGKIQAKKLAKRLAKEKFDIIYCSDLGRCKDTLAPYLKISPKIKVVYTKALREKNGGIFQGKHIDVKRAWMEKQKEKYPDRRDFRPPKGESFNDLRKRSVKFIESLIKKEKGKRVLIVSHGGPITMILLHLFEKHPQTHFKKYLPQNTALSIVKINEDKKHHPCLINCVKHL